MWEQNENDNNRKFNRKYNPIKMNNVTTGGDILSGLLSFMVIISISLLITYYKQRTIWKIYNTQKSIPTLRESLILSFIVSCWPLYLLLDYLNVLNQYKH